MPLEFETMREYLLFANDQLLRLHRAAQDQGSGRDSLAIDRAEAYIRANYMRPITLAVVSNEVSLNYAYFSNSFKKQTGRTFSEYLRDIRLDAAKKLLRQPDIRISEVAERVGYDSYKSFSRPGRVLLWLQARPEPEKRRVPDKRAGAGRPEAACRPGLPAAEDVRT